jgi:hypothetical protein
VSTVVMTTHTIKPPTSSPLSIHWQCRHTWKRSAHNTSWCLLGCAIGDLGTIFAFQIWAPETNPLVIMSLAIINGLLTSILLETILLSQQMILTLALKTALGMSLVSMIAMEVAMNATDYLLVGGARITWWSLLPSLLAGFLAPWPYNYWRLKRLGKACH